MGNGIAWLGYAESSNKSRVVGLGTRLSDISEEMIIQLEPIIIGFSVAKTRINRPQRCN